MSTASRESQIPMPLFGFTDYKISSLMNPPVEMQSVLYAMVRAAKSTKHSSNVDQKDTGSHDATSRMKCRNATTLTILHSVQTVMLQVTEVYALQ